MNPKTRTIQVLNVIAILTASLILIPFPAKAAPTSQFDCVNWTCNNFVSPSTLSVASNGTAEIRQSNPNVCDWTNSYYDSLIRGAPPPAQGPSQGTAFPSNITSVSVSVSFLSRNLGPACSGTSGQGPRYHFFMSLYFRLSSAVSACGTYSGSSWLDTQVRLQDTNGVDSAIGTNSTYGGGSDPAVGACGWSTTTLQLSIGSNGVLVANVANQCSQAEAAWGIPLGNTCTLTGVEIGSEGYDFNAVNTNWYNVILTIGTSPVSDSFTFTPTSPVAGQNVSFSGTTLGGTAPYSYSWTFGDGTIGANQTSSHTYAFPGTYTVTLTVEDTGSPQQTATSSQTVTISPGTPSPPSQQPQSQSPCALCQVIASGTTMWLLATGGLIATAVVAYLRARARFGNARRLKELTSIASTGTAQPRPGLPGCFARRAVAVGPS